ncbi:MAG: single-stranded DNA-binding protein [Gammaproteobacteria bacterium]|nr:single-stranded DNA-binding protein [Gammaproteobacteria bacterium]MCP5135427.1 single-stranded DNA-binding protein [Gammaproteobacteria bacterium]
MEITQNGNLGADAVRRTASTPEGERYAINFRVFVENRVPDGSGGYKDQGGFWLGCTRWTRNPDFADRLTALLRKGQPVIVIGSLRQDAWKDEGQNEQRGMAMNVSHVALDTIAVKDVTFLKEKTDE